MNFQPVYLDSSAIVKLILPEAETDALMSALASWPDRVSSALARVEVRRALMRAGATPAQRARAAAVFSGLVLVRVDEPVLSLASSLRGADLRALDAIHLATALSLGDDPEAFVVYDKRLAGGASRLRLPVTHPGAKRLT